MQMFKMIMLEIQYKFIIFKSVIASKLSQKIKTKNLKA